MALTRLAHRLVRDHFSDQAKAVAIDGTCGNGHDTEFLARLGFTQVVGFDVQEQAIRNTQQRIQDAALTNVRLIQDGHQHLLNYLDEPIDCAMFNFGYLPKADKSITTQSDTSLMALQAVLSVLTRGGILSLICYPGHSAGAVETQDIQTWLANLQGWQVQEYASRQSSSSTPVLYTVQR